MDWITEATIIKEADPSIAVSSLGTIVVISAVKKLAASTIAIVTAAVVTVLILRLFAVKALLPVTTRDQGDKNERGEQARHENLLDLEICWILANHMPWIFLSWNLKIVNGSSHHNPI